MSNTASVLLEAGIAYPSRAPEFTILVVLCFHIMCLCVHSVMLWCPLRFSQKKVCLVRLCFQLFVGGLVSYLRYLGLFAHSGFQHILWYFLHCVRYATSFPRLSIFDRPFGIL